MKRSKSYFYHSAVNFDPICMKLMPKCSEFNARSSDIRHDPVTSLPLLAIGGQRSGGSRPCKMCGFCHNSVNSCPICMKSAPNCSLFCSPHSYAKYRTVAEAKVCALPSARSSFLWFGCIPKGLGWDLVMAVGKLTKWARYVCIQI